MPKIPPVYAAEVARERAEAFRQGTDYATDEAIRLLNEKVLPAAAAAIEWGKDSAYRRGYEAACKDQASRVLIKLHSKPPAPKS